MEATVAATHSFSSYVKHSTCTHFFPSLFHPKSSLKTHQSAQSLGFRGGLRLHCARIRDSQHRKFAVVCASEGGNNPPESVAQLGWLLEPVGDGDWKHIGYKVEMPGSYEIFSTQMIVGRTPEKADLVIPVDTVSGVHAQLVNEKGSLFVTDLDSTNGTFLNEKRVPPGGTVRVPPGSLIIFGDEHLAVFRVSKLKKVEGESDENVESEETATPQPETTS